MEDFAASIFPENHDFHHHHHENLKSCVIHRQIFIVTCMNILSDSIVIRMKPIFLAGTLYNWDGHFVLSVLYV